MLRALVGAKLKGWHAVKAKERQLAALQTSSKRGGKVQADFPEPIDDGQARDHAAKAVGVAGRRSVQGVLVDHEKGPRRALSVRLDCSDERDQISGQTSMGHCRRASALLVVGIADDR